jgi:hypothetical protein
MEPTNGTERSGRRFSVQSLVAKLHRLRRPQPRGSRRERHGDPVSSDSLSTPHVLCSNCKSVFRHSQILQKALASHLTGKERNDEAAANSARHQEIDKSYKDQVHRVKLQLDLELSQEQVASGHDLDGRHAEKVQRISKILSTGRDITERFLHHPNLQSLESSIRRDKCHFCSIVKNVIHGPLTSNPKQDTQIWIKMSEWPSSVGIEVHVSREKHLSISDMFSQSNGERIWATKVTKSGEKYGVARVPRLTEFSNNNKFRFATIKQDIRPHNRFNKSSSTCALMASRVSSKAPILRLERCCIFPDKAGRDSAPECLWRLVCETQPESPSRSNVLHPQLSLGRAPKFSDAPIRNPSQVRAGNIF